MTAWRKPMIYAFREIDSFIAASNSSMQSLHKLFSSINLFETQLPIRITNVRNITVIVLTGVKYVANTTKDAQKAEKDYSEDTN